jgi:toxin YoeB
MKLRWADEALEDMDHWHENDIEVWKKVRALIKRIQRDPDDGWSRPKALQRELKGWWSRRINDHDRLVYRVVHEGRTAVLEILQCRGHYSDNDDGRPRKKSDRK